MKTNESSPFHLLEHPMNEWNIVEKHVIVTGASDGIGRETAFQLFCKGAHVGLVGRNPDKTNRVADEFQKKRLELMCAWTPQGQQTSPVESSQVQAARPDVFIADLSRCAEVKRLAIDIKSRWPHVDVLINNAGGYFEKRLMTVDGFEQTFALNHLSYFLLAYHLTPSLQSRPEARIINVSSKAHRGISIAWDDLQSLQKYNGVKAYQRSKLANILFSNALARRLAGSMIAVNSLHPGFVASKFGHNNSGLSSTLLRWVQMFARSEAKGAETPLYLAESARLTGISGQYFADCKSKRPAAYALDTDVQDRLWKETEKLLVPWL